MRFIVHQAVFEKVAERTSYGTIPLKIKKTGRELSLKETAGRLLEIADKELELENLLTGCDESLQQDLRDGLTLLSAFGIAEVFDDPRDGEKDIRVAGERDYRDIAAFLAKSDNISYGNFKVDFTEYINEDNIRARQFMNLEYNFLYRSGGEIKGVLLMAMPREYSFERICRIGWAVIARELSDQAEEIINGLLDYAQTQFGDEFAACRYFHIQPDDRLVTILQQRGFTETAHLEKETNDGHDVVIYDCRRKQEGI